MDNFNLALNTKEPSAYIYKCIGRCHESLGNYDLTKQFYLKSVHLEPNNEKCWVSLISFLISQNNLNKAEYYLENAIGVGAKTVRHPRFTDGVIASNINSYLAPQK